MARYSLWLRFAVSNNARDAVILTRATIDDGAINRIKPRPPQYLHVGPI